VSRSDGTPDGFGTVAVDFDRCFVQTVDVRVRGSNEDRPVAMRVQLQFHPDLEAVGRRPSLRNRNGERAAADLL